MGERQNAYQLSQKCSDRKRKGFVGEIGHITIVKGCTKSVLVARTL